MTGTIEERISQAQGEMMSYRWELHQQLEVLTSLRNFDRERFMNQLDFYTRAQARLTALELLNSEDLFHMLARSASKVGDAPAG